jgi:nitroreductase
MSLDNKDSASEFQIYNSDIKQAIIRSQHCQRNWDLSKEITQEDLDLLITAATQCPSKQNVAYYKIHFITKRDLIESIHSQTDGFGINTMQTTTNTQVLANLLVVLEKYDAKESYYRNDQWDQLKKGINDNQAEIDIERDRNIAIGIAAGYLNVVASLLGYSTGFCSCFRPANIKEILKLNNEPILLIGIGFKDETLNRRIHHIDHSLVFPTKNKQSIPVNIIK